MTNILISDHNNDISEHAAENGDLILSGELQKIFKKLDSWQCEEYKKIASNAKESKILVLEMVLEEKKKGVCIVCCWVKQLYLLDLHTNVY